MAYQHQNRSGKRLDHAEFGHGPSQQRQPSRKRLPKRKSREKKATQAHFALVQGLTPFHLRVSEQFRFHRANPSQLPRPCPSEDRLQRDPSLLRDDFTLWLQKRSWRGLAEVQTSMICLRIRLHSRRSGSVRRVRRMSRQQLDRSPMFRVCRIQSRRRMVWLCTSSASSAFLQSLLALPTEFLLQADLELLTARCGD